MAAHRVLPPSFRPAPREEARPAAARMAQAMFFTLVCLAAAPPSARAQSDGAPAVEARRTFDIPSGPLDRALSRFGRQAGVQLVVNAELTTGLSSPGVSGNLEVDEALRRLLAGTGLAAVRVPGGEYTLRRATAAGGGAALPEAASLPEVRVTASVEPEPAAATFSAGQLARGATLGVLGVADAMEAPFSMTSYTEAMVNDAQARTIGDVLAYDSSVRLTGQTNGVSESFTIRGFPINEGNIGDLMFAGQYGIAPNYQASAIYAERIELIKGPTALLNGIAPNGSIGGALNVVPKRAADTPLTRLVLDYESKSQLGARFDVGRRFGQDQAWGIRVNGLYRAGDAARDKQSVETTVGAVAIDYRGSRLRASLDYVDQYLRVDGPARQPSLAAGIALPAAPDPRRNLAQRWDYSDIRDRALLLKAEYDFTESVTGYAGVGASREDTAGLYSNPVIVAADGTVQQTPASILFDLEKYSAEAGLRGRFETGAVSHRWSAAVNHYYDKFDVGFNFSSASFASNLYSPVDVPQVFLSDPALAPYSRSRLRGLALTDTMGFLDDRVLLTLGVRHQRVHSESPSANEVYDKSAVTPMAGIVFKATPRISLYANYIQGLSAGGTAPTAARNAGEIFPPYKSRQSEAGVKYDGGAWMASAAAFQIAKPSGQLDADGYYRPSAEQRNRGLEFTAAGEIARGLRAMAGLTLIDAELTKGSAAVVGNDAPGVPQLQANLGTEWDVPGLAGLTFTGRVVHSTRQYVDQANAQRLPAWTRLDLGARYATRVNGVPVTYRLLVSNVTDRHYWAAVTSWGGLAIGEPRAIRVSAQIDF